jgi:hypothetical protein
MTHPLLHPPLELVRSRPVCPTCQAPLKWYDLGGTFESRCIDPRCDSHFYRNLAQAKATLAELKSAKNQEVRLMFLLLCPIIIPAWLIGGVGCMLFHLVEFGINSFRMFNDIWHAGELD